MTERELIALRLRQVHFPRPKNTTDEQQWAQLHDHAKRWFLKYADALIKPTDNHIKLAFVKSWGEDWSDDDDYN